MEFPEMKIILDVIMKGNSPMHFNCKNTLLYCTLYSTHSFYKHNQLYQKCGCYVSMFKNVWGECHDEGGSGDNDPEEPLAHPKDSPDPGQCCKRSIGLL